ncbi:hypothetical protein MKK84_29555 [Methylobacterium sp. E-065]|uniref:hypothetical protein n=1 Tax=Methylobacterium sp. E-065 TaxID=2836583 RepID=UPI001FB9FD1F|nr:hypothetical protein [Methylobacterium sp. E-065]MCJ2021515.1 hypothetical protein [Methylobacterium sp. E-065]
MSAEMTVASSFTPDHGHPSAIASARGTHDDLDGDIRPSSLTLQVLGILLKILILISSLPVLVIALVAERFLHKQPTIQRTVTGTFVALSVVNAAGLILTILYYLLA